MKMRKLFAVILALLLLTGCGAESAAGGGSPVEDFGGPAENEAFAPQIPEGGDNTLLADRKLIRRVEIRAETDDLEALVPVIDARVAELGGYIERKQVYSDPERTSRRAVMTIRIPSARLPEFAAEIDSGTNVLRYNETQDDVTLSYVDTEGRLKVLEAEQARLLEFMEQAKTVGEMLEIERRLTEVRYQLESVASQLKVLSNQVDFATVELTLEQVIVYTEVTEKSVWERSAGGFMESLRAVGRGFTEFFVWTVSHLPQLVLTAAAALAVVFVIRRAVKKQQKRREDAVRKMLAGEQPGKPEE